MAPLNQETLLTELEEFIDEVLGPGGLFSLVIKDYEYREGQIQLARHFGRALLRGEHAVAEAGTGIGKTIAYLVPSLWYAVREKKRIAVSTRTINLQEQILGKDLPALEEALHGSLKFRVALAKGRGNYLCLRRVELESRTGLFASMEEAQLFGDLFQWAYTQARVGDREEASGQGWLHLWERANSSSEDCLFLKCPYHGRCFVYRAREGQKTAHLLIVNHALLFADLALRRQGPGEKGILEELDALVFDEAHHLEEVATSWLGVKVSHHRLRSLVDSAIALMAEKHPVGRNLPLPAREEVLALGRELLGKSEEFFEELGAFASFQTRRLLPEHRGVFQDSLSPCLSDLEMALAGARSGLAENLGEGEWGELEALEGRITRVGNDLRYLLEQQGEGAAYWVECPASGGRNRPANLQAAPISIAGDMREMVFEAFPSVLLTSATLCSNQDFSFITGRLGLTGDDYRPLILPAPFDFYSNCLFFVPADAPDPRFPGSYETWAQKMIGKLVELSGGRALVLFTSYLALQRACASLSPRLEAMGYKLLAQGQKERGLLLREFKKDVGSVLFGTDSFWEGVDVKGEALSCVVIHKLPFPVPDTPIMEARLEQLDSQGENPFLAYSVPLTALKLKQGFGRLLRSREDRGVVAVLDGQRLNKRNYGRLILSSLPEARKTDCLEEVASFFAKKN